MPCVDSNPWMVISKIPKGTWSKKNIFSIIVVGNELPRRIRRVCELFTATIYKVPESRQAVNALLSSTVESKNESIKVLDSTKSRIKQCLEELARSKKNGGSPLKSWEKWVDEEIRICGVMQKFYALEDSSQSESVNVGQRIAAKGWVPEEYLSELKRVLKRPEVMCTALYDEQEHLSHSPPTYFKTNVFTGSYQGIVDTYGIANYKEANPGLFTIITFPFLFAVMYGDIFHGSCLTIAALLMLYFEKSLVEQRRKGEMGEIFSMAFSGRYILILMGLFAIFCGTIYNDVAAVPLNLYGSSYTYPEEGSNSTNLIFNGQPYPWGLDPEWYHKGNSLQFVNSMKMKFSVTVGVIQMSIGICLGLANDIYFHDTLSIIFEFIPRILFMMCTFGYMIFMIIYKMCIDWEGLESPNIIQTMIKMFLSPTFKPEPPLYDADTQHAVQIFCLIVAFLAIPIMLFPKAIIKYFIWKAKYQHAPNYSPYQEEKKDFEMDVEEMEYHEQGGGHGRGGGHGAVGPDWTFGDEMITTGIHTIEFVLGCVSNTASYLRLWALSLAHAQLSEVFWNKALFQYGIQMMPLGFVGFAVWAAATVFVLLLMDVLECFLHALRLHWVEFQNKFYRGEGYKFVPFTLGEEE